ncbi:hypothetical protein [Kribbella sandramycini]|uniref:Uncharacterized protein n=1 Tax=Kribbella sandramycini TaxID=60450 RepID=A0A841SFR1_9ACTN|nr:hypothetical protein [Kribbella sandramycini]MBB6570798.1 hypothetical protein [Kribbella sandramycini]
MVVDRDAVVRRNAFRDKVLMMDRTDWTQEQWVQDAFDVMADPDGSPIALMNRHVQALLTEIVSLRAQLEPGDAAQAKN